MKFRDATGVLQECPPDLPKIVADLFEKVIVWSLKGRTHQVRYGLQVKTFKQDGKDPSFAQLAAATEFGCCVRHYAECEGVFG